MSSIQDIIERIENDMKLLKIELKGITKKKAKEPKEEPVLDETETKTFGKLKDIRKELASTKNVALFMVCHNSTLYNIIKEKPQTLSDLQKLMSKKQAEDYATELFAKLKDSRIL